MLRSLSSVLVSMAMALRAVHAEGNYGDASPSNVRRDQIDPAVIYQTIENFGASERGQ